MLKRTISFNEALHRYTDEDNNVYTSVTTVIGKYHEQFNEDYWAEQKAKELGVTKEIIKANWKESRDYANNKGTKTHSILEDSINASNGKANLEVEFKRTRLGNGELVSFNKINLHILANSPLAQLYPKIYAFLRKHIEEGWTLYAEKRIYWHPYLIAGTIDCLLIKGKFFIIVDWKTNKDELKFESGYYKKINGIKSNIWIKKNERFYFPLNHREFCKGHIYTLQLSLYAHLMELWGYKCVGLILFHIHNEIPKDPINISYWDKDVQNLCTHFSNGLITTSTIKNNTNQIRFGIS